MLVQISWHIWRQIQHYVPDAITWSRTKIDGSKITRNEILLRFLELPIATPINSPGCSHAGSPPVVFPVALMQPNDLFLAVSIILYKWNRVDSGFIAMSQFQL